MSGIRNVRTSEMRMGAFCAGMRRAGLAVREEYLRYGDYRIPGGKQAAAELLALRERPTAIMTINDLKAIGAFLLLRERGLEVPRHMSVIGFNRVELSQIMHPPMTTFHTSRNAVTAMFFKAFEAEAQGRQDRMERNWWCVARR